MTSKRISAFLLCIFVTTLVTKALSADENQGWSTPINGLVAKMTFEVDESTIHSQVIHPILNLRNVTKNPIAFFWCAYHAGIFKITSRQGVVPNITSRTRSGGVGATVLTIKPDQTVQLDAYDYGYGLSRTTDMYAFHTASLQAVLTSGSYFVSYSLDYTTKNLKKYLTHYDWIQSDTGTLWTGKIGLKKIFLVLK